MILGLLVDPQGDLKAQVEKKAKEAGDAGGKTLGLSMSTALKGAAVVIGAGLAIATKGALEAEAAQGKFMAATGKSREEAKRFVSQMDALAGTAGAVGRSFEEIADVGIAVEQQFGTTGDKTRELTGHILEYAKVTEQDARQAALDLEDTLSAYNLAAEDAVSVMDRLVASSQKYGTDAGPETLSVLRNMAPALQAMGLGVDDGIEILNAFEVAGLDAATAQRGLQTAVRDLKPGENLDDLIARIGAIEDPTKRAQAAIDIFGGRAGPALAAVIEPGMTSLDEFGISAEEAAGKTGKAADDMLTFTDRISGWGQKLLAGAREVGQQFGPALTGLGSLVSLTAPFARKLGDLFKQVATKVLPQVVAAGTATGTAEATAHANAATGPQVLRTLLAKFGLMTPAKVAAATAAGAATGAAEGQAAAAAAAGPTAMSKWGNAGRLAGNAFKLAFVAGVGVVIVDVLVNQVEEAKNTVRNDPNKITPNDMFNMRAPAWAGAQLAVAKEMESLGGVALAAFNAEWDKGIASGLSPSDPDLLERARLAGLAAAPMFTAGWSSSSAWQSMADPVEDAAGAAAGAGVVAFNRELLSGEPSALTSARVLKRAVLDGLGPLPEAAGDTGRDVVADLAGALQKKSPVEAAMEALQWAIENPLALTRRRAEIEGFLTGDQYKNALKSSNPLVRAVAEQQGANLIAEWESITGKAWTWGNKVGGAWIQAMIDKLSSPASKTAINRAINTATKAMQGQSPPPEGPLMHVDDMGAAIGQSWITSLARGLGGDLRPALAGVRDQLGRAVPFFAAGGSGFALSSSLDSGATLRLQHDVDLHGAPAGLSAEDVASILNSGVDATGLHFALRHAGGALPRRRR